MFDSLIKFVREAPPEELAAIEIEEMALVSAWYDSHRDNAEFVAEYADLPEKIEYWLAHSSQVDVQTEGRRLQPLLREVLDRAVSERPPKLHRSELDLLVHAHNLIKRHPDPGRFERLAIFFEREHSAIEAARDGMEPVAGLAGLADFLRIITPEDILQAQKRSVSNFAGLKMPGRGPVFHHKGNVKVMGYVPDDCMLVAEDGSCLVHGFVFGRVAATNDCEVRDNIAGVVVVSLGDIRARNALTTAFVVSKWGQVVLRRTERVKLLFAGRLLHIKEDADGGRYASPEIVVDGHVHGGEFSVSRSMKAERFETAPGSETVIVLRRSITPEDYGGLVDPIATRLLGSIRRVRHQKEALRERIRLAENERRQFATNAIQFMTGGDALLQGLQAIVKQEQQLSLCIRVISALDSVTLAIEEQISASIADMNAADDEEVRDAAALVRELTRELEDAADLSAMDDADGVLAGDIEEVAAILGDLNRAEASRNISTDLLLNLRNRSDEWQQKRGKLIESLERKMVAIEKLLGTSDVRTKNAKLSELKVLARILQAAGKRPPGDVLAARTQSSFVKLMLRQIESRRDRIKQYQEKIEAADAELAKLGERLENEAKIPVPKEFGETEEPPHVTGAFSPGIVICTDRYFVEDTRAPEATTLITGDSGTEIRCYMRSQNRILPRDEALQSS